METGIEMEIILIAKQNNFNLYMEKDNGERSY